MTLIFNKLVEVVKVHVHGSAGSRNTKTQKTHVTLTFEYDLEFSRVLEISRYMFVQNFIKLSAAVRELSCLHFLPYRNAKKIRKSGPVTLTLNL